MTHCAVTVVGRDRPGIISETTAALSGLGLNIEDSSMTLLRGVFAFTLVCAGEVSATAVDDALEPVRSDSDLALTVQVLPDDASFSGVAPEWVLSVHGADHPGIVSAVTGVVAQHGGNIVDLSTRLTGDLYVLLAEVSLAPDTDVDRLAEDLGVTGQRVGVDVTLRRAEADLL